MTNDNFSVSEPIMTRTSDLDEAREFVSTNFYSHFLDFLQPPGQLAASFGVIQVGPLTLGDLRYGADVTMKFGELGAYHVALPLQGRLASRQGTKTFVGTTSTAAVFQPIGDTVLEHWGADCRLLALKIDRAALERQLGALLDAPIRSPLRPGSNLDVTRGPGHGWTRLILLLADEISSPSGMVFGPLVAGPLCESILNGFLLTTDHQYRDALERPRPRWAPRTVKRVIDAIQAHPDQPLTATALAESAGVSVRCLQDAFQRHVGMSPMTYLRWVRLARTHDDLRRADPRQATVANIAHRWGFTHLGRFAAAYRARYGAAPSETLRQVEARSMPRP
jgi:AraC-like DNA-binding protein